MERRCNSIGGVQKTRESGVCTVLKMGTELGWFHALHWQGLVHSLLVYCITHSIGFRHTNGKCLHASVKQYINRVEMKYFMDIEILIECNFV